MTNDEIRIAIAESQGWSPVAVRSANSMWFKSNEIHRLLERSTKLPNYPSDLNAMHEVEKSLHKSFEESSAYEHFLRNVVYKTKHSGVGIGFATLNATALQRAEAYLRVKGLWKE